MASVRSELEWLEGVCKGRHGAPQDAALLARVVAAMDEHKGDAAVQAAACQALLRSAASAEALIKAGAHLRVLRAMRLGGGALLQGAALEVLAAIASSGNNHVLLVRLGAGARCTEAMTSLIGDALVAAACCAALEQLARTGATAVQLAQAGCHTAVLMAMATHPKDERLQTMACSAFWALSSISSAYVALLVQCKAHEAIIKAMARHPGSGLLQEHAAGALANMAVLANCAVLLRAGAQECLLVALRHHSDDPAVVRFATIALQNLHRA
jgi:hypothetical protein